MSRLKFLLHYFGEAFDEINGEGADMDDNSRNPKSKKEAKDQVVLLLKAIEATRQADKSKEIVFTLLGKINAIIKSSRADTQIVYHSGNDFDDKFWMALIRQVLV